MTWGISTFARGFSSRMRRMPCSTFPPKPSPRLFEEVKFKVPWGYVSGKWFGPKNVRPIVGLHGWKDNAGSFDTLAPLLPLHLAFYAVDLPGHGLSSWLPEGCSYHALDYITLMHRMMNAFSWDKISLICHSMSAINGFTFCSLFPDKCDMLISLDVLKPVTRPTDFIINTMMSYVESAVKVSPVKILGKSAPSRYTFNEMIEKLHKLTDKSIDKESCKYILKRSTKPSNRVPKKFYNSQDSRLKGFMFYNLEHDVVVKMAAKITTPFLFIKASGGPYYEDEKYHNDVIKVLKMKPTFENYLIQGTHHVHLNEPKKVADIINPFILKYRSK